MEAIVPLYQTRAKTLLEMAEQAAFFFHDAATLPYDQGAVAKFITSETTPHLVALAQRMEILPAFDQKSLEEMVAAYLEETGLKFKILAQPMRVAITGTTTSPGLFETMAVLGKEQTIARFKRALELI